MAKKSTGKSGRRKSGSSTGPVNPHITEKTMAEVTRLLSEQEFSSIEEANAFLQTLVGQGMPQSSAPETPLEKAQDLIYQAWDSQSEQRRVQLARRALKISPDCADAYILLAEETAESLEEAVDLYEQALQAGERAIGPEAFEAYTGDFWGILETRPYMRAREALALALWEMGEREAATEHFQAMLELNPDDNQGVRYMLLLMLMDDNATEETEELLRRYKDDASAVWMYSHALFLYRQEGKGRKANAQLRKAVKTNPHVADCLLGRQRLPPILPPYMGFGDETEAAHYLAESLHLWLREPGAIEWVRQI